MQTLTDTPCSHAIAKRVTVSLATQSRAFLEHAGIEGQTAIRKVRANNWDFSILDREQLLRTERALQDVDESLAGDFSFKGIAIRLASTTGVCDLCGETHLRFLFSLHDAKTGQVLFPSVGSNCIITYLYNALGVRTSEEARKLLQKHIDRLIREHMAEEFQKAHPTFLQDTQSLLDRYWAVWRFAYQYRTRWMRNQIRELERIVKYFNTNGMVTPVRLAQLEGKFTTQITNVETEVARTRDRQQAEFVMKQAVAVNHYLKILAEHGAKLLDPERRMIEGLIERRTPLAELNNTEYRILDEVQRRAEVPDTSRMEEARQLLDVFSKRSDRWGDFARSLSRQLAQSGYLSKNQLAYVFGDSSGLDPYYRPAMKRVFEEESNGTSQQPLAKVA